MLTDLSIIDKDDRKKVMTNNNLYFNNYSADSELTQMSKDPNYEFLKIHDTTQRTKVLSQLKSAFENMKKTGCGFPNYKNKKSRYSVTGRILQTFNLKITGDDKFCYINIPKIKKLKIVVHNDEFRNNINTYKFNSYTISKQGEKYFIAFQCETTIPIPTPAPIIKETSIGIDFGVIRTITTSNEEDFNNKLYSNRVSALKDNLKELARLQKIMSHKIDYHKKNKSEIKFYETSAFKRIKNKINKLHFKISSIRENIQHEISKDVVNKPNVDTIILEKLNIKGMTKRSEKGKSNRKKGLHKALNDVGLYSIKNKIQYKAEKLGKNVKEVDPKYTSLKCSKCGHISHNNRKSQSLFVCEKCGLTINADFNAALNIKEKFF